ncbi:MAG: pitrilysin family protein [Bryobacteraceae bacterium]
MRSPTRPREIETTHLPNGVRIISEYMPHVRSASVGVWVGSGSRSESPEENGLSHFIEHMLFKGSKKRSAEQIAKEADSIGGGLDAFTSKELVSYNVKVLDEHLPKAIDILADLVLNPRFDAEDIAKEKGVVLEELKMEHDTPEYVLHDMFTRNFWRGHALGRPILGTKETISRFSRDSVQSYYRRAYTPANIVITAAGNLRHKKLVELAGSHFSQLKKRAAKSKDLVPTPYAPLVFRDKKSLEQVHLYVAVPAVPLSDKSRFACYLLNTILGGGMSSRLFQNIRERQGLAYTVMSELSMYRDCGCMAVYAGTSLKSANRVIECVVDEMRAMQDTLVPDEELRRAKDNMKGSLVLGLESTSSRMGNLARQELFFGRFFSIDEMLDGVERVKASEIQEIAQRFFQPKNMALAMLGKLDGFKLTRGDLMRR